VLAAANPDLYAKYCQAFEELFGRQETASVCALAEEVIHAHGGWLFDGYKLEASPDWRLSRGAEKGQR